jgi:hypothetical protein
MIPYSDVLCSEGGNKTVTVIKRSGNKSYKHVAVESRKKNRKKRMTNKMKPSMRRQRERETRRQRARLMHEEGERERRESKRNRESD